MKKQLTNTPDCAGFSIIDVLVALTMFALMFTGFASFLVGSLQATGYAEHMTVAATIAQDKLEEVRNDATTCTNDSMTQGELTYTRTCTTAAGPIAGTQEITVTVDWTDHTSHTVALKTLIPS